MFEVAGNVEDQGIPHMIMPIPRQHRVRRGEAQFEIATLIGAVGQVDGDPQPARARRIVMRVVMPVERVPPVGAGLNDPALDTAQVVAAGHRLDPAQKRRTAKHDIEGSAHPLRRLDLAPPELVDMIGKDVSGKDAEAALGRAHITVNKNSVPNDPRSPFVTSGLRLGTPAVTTRGYVESDCVDLANWIADVLDAPADDAVIERVADAVKQQCARLPVYG